MLVYKYRGWKFEFYGLNGILELQKNKIKRDYIKGICTNFSF